MAGTSRRLICHHFNDVYNADGGSGARFVAAIKRAVAEEQTPAPDADADANADHASSTLILFSGDAFFPSNVSTVTLGAHMFPVLNMSGVDAACLGNHDVDGGLGNFLSLAAKCSFPWLCSNADDASTGAPFAGCRRTLVLERGGLSVGLIGLVEPEWAATLPCVEEEDIVVRPFVEEGRRLARELRAGVDGEPPCDVIIALTHMRLPNDRKLALEAGGDIDLVLGGHDHDAAYEPGSSNGTRVAPVVKSGTDFRNFSRIVLNVPARTATATSAATATIAEYTLLDVPKDGPEDSECAAAVSSFTSALEARMSDVIGRSANDLDARFATVRSRESNLGSLVAEIFRRVLRADAALLNSGTFRSDAIHPAGNLTVRDLVTLFPLLDETAVVRVTGAQLLAALENGVSKWPRLEGRFPQVAGIRFAFDAREPEGKRVIRASVEVAGAPLDEQRTYALATKAFVAPEGKDGYGALEGAPAIRDPSSCPVLPVVLRSALHALSAVNGLRRPTAGVRAFAERWRRRAAAASSSGKQVQEQQEEAATAAAAGDGEQHDQEELDFARHAMLGEGLVSADPVTGDLLIDAKVDGRIQIVGEEEALQREQEAGLAAAGGGGA